MNETAEKGWVRQRYMDGLKETRREVRSYWLNHAFLEGYQWLWDNRIDGRIDQLPTDIDRVQATINKMRANNRTLLAQLTQRDMVFENMPTLADDSTMRASRLAEQIITDLHNEHDWEHKREALCTTALKGGTGAVAVDWDTEANTSVETVLSISEFVVEPGARDAERARWWVKAQILPPAEVQAMFDLEAEPPSDATDGMSSFNQKLVSTSQGNDGQVPLTLVLTYYERPNRLNEKGCFKVEVGGKILQEGDWPFPFKHRLNLAIARETLVENRWAGTTTYDDVRPIQVLYNVVWSGLIEHMRNAGNARLTVPASAYEMVRQLSDVAGEIIQYPDGSQAPAYLNPPQLPVWLREMLSNLSDAMDDLMGVHDVSRGQAPPNIESGYGISILAEKDSSPATRLIKEVAHVFSEVGSMTLMIHEQMVTKKRTSTVRGGIGPERIEWTGKDIQGQVNVSVPQDKIVPRSRAAQQAFADKAVEMGLVEGVVQYSYLADLPGQEDIIAAAAPDVAKARRENSSFVLNEVKLPAPFDDHAIHIQTHNQFRKTDQYEMMSEDARKDVDMHIKAHETLAAEELGGQRMKAQVDPALGQAANANEAPALDPLAPLPVEGPPTEAMTQAPVPDAMMDPSAITDDILMQLQAMTGEQ